MFYAGTAPGGQLAHDVLLRGGVPRVQQVLVGYVVETCSTRTQQYCSIHALMRRQLTDCPQCDYAQTLLAAF